MVWRGKMGYERKTKEQLIKEIKVLQGKVAELNKSGTERRKAEEALKRSEEKWRSLVENAPNIIMIIDRDHKLQFINRTVPGISAEEVIGREHYDYIEPEYHDVVRKTIERVFNTGETGSYQIKGAGPKGQAAWYETYAGPIKSDGQVVAVTLISADITGRKKAEKELLAYQERLKALVSEISGVEEKERKRIAADLHDSISQILAISKLKLGMLQREPALNGFVKSMGEINEFLDQAISSTRSLMFELSPPVLHDLSFEEAAEQLAEQFEEQYGISIEFEDDGRPKPIEEEIRIFLFKTVRELLFNIVKHAQARNVKITVRKANNTVEIIVKDDGIGFDHSRGEFVKTNGKDGGFGLFNIRERIRYFGGNFEIKSRPGHGTRAVLSVPVRFNKKFAF